MMRKLLITCGFVILLGSLFFIFYLHISASAASSLDQGKLYQIGGCGTCQQPCQAASFQLTIPARILAETDTQAVNIDIVLKPCLTNGPWIIQINAPQFALSPSSSQIRMSIPPHSNDEEIKYGWVLTPQQIGTFAITSTLFYQGISVAYQVIGLTVTNTFGLNLGQAQLLSSIGSILGGFFGPGFTFVWLYGLWKERKAKKGKGTTPATENIPANIVIDVHYPQGKQKRQQSKKRKINN